MVSEAEKADAEVTPELEEAKKPTRGRPRREVTNEEAWRKVMLKVLRSQDRSLHGIKKAMLTETGGGQPSVPHCRFGRYFLAMEGQPGAVGLEAAVNELLAEWTSGGWYPLHVSSQSGIFDAGGGQLTGDHFTILWGHD